jgi:recombination protein RecA
MAPPFKGVEFEILFGVGIDRMLEIMDMASDLGILRKYGKTITYNEIKYELDEFRTLLTDNDEFFDKLKKDITDKINDVNEINETENEDTLQEIGFEGTEA